MMAPKLCEDLMAYGPCAFGSYDWLQLSYAIFFHRLEQTSSVFAKATTANTASFMSLVMVVQRPFYMLLQMVRNARYPAKHPKQSLKGTI